MSKCLYIFFSPSSWTLTAKIGNRRITDKNTKTYPKTLIPHQFSLAAANSSSAVLPPHSLQTVMWTDNIANLSCPRVWCPHWHTQSSFVLNNFESCHKHLGIVGIVDSCSGKVPPSLCKQGIRGKTPSKQTGKRRHESVEPIGLHFRFPQARTPDTLEASVQLLSVLPVVS